MRPSARWVFLALLVGTGCAAPAPQFVTRSSHAPSRAAGHRFASSSPHAEVPELDAPLDPEDALAHGPEDLEPDAEESTEADVAARPEEPPEVPGPPFREVGPDLTRERPTTPHAPVATLPLRGGADLPGGEPCRARLRELGAVWREIEAPRGVRTPVLVTGTLGGVRYRGAGRMTFVADCRLALALARVGPELVALGVSEVHFVGAYSYRMSRVGRLSYHAYGLALDVHAMTIDGSLHPVSTAYRRGLEDGCSPSAPPLNRVACRLRRLGAFRENLTPDTNADHHDHFHWGLAPLPGETEATVAPAGHGARRAPEGPGSAPSAPGAARGDARTPGAARARESATRVPSGQGNVETRAAPAREEAGRSGSPAREGDRNPGGEPAAKPSAPARPAPRQSATGGEASMERSSGREARRNPPSGGTEAKGTPVAPARRQVGHAASSLPHGGSSEPARRASGAPQREGLAERTAPEQPPVDAGGRGAPKTKPPHGAPPAPSEARPVQPPERGPASEPHGPGGTRAVGEAPARGAARPGAARSRSGRPTEKRKDGSGAAAPAVAVAEGRRAPLPDGKVRGGPAAPPTASDSPAPATPPAGEAAPAADRAPAGSHRRRGPSAPAHSRSKQSAAVVAPPTAPPPRQQRPSSGKKQAGRAR